MLSGEVELDDFFLDSRDRSRGRRSGRGTDGQPMICAVPDCSGATYRRFAEEHMGRSAHVRADGLPSIGAGLRGFPGLDRRKFDGSDPDASLPTVHHVIPDFEAWALGTFHGLPLTRLQSYAVGGTMILT